MVWPVGLARRWPGDGPSLVVVVVARAAVDMRVAVVSHGDGSPVVAVMVLTVPVATVVAKR